MKTVVTFAEIIYKQMSVASMRFQDTLRLFLTFVLLVTLGSTEDLSGLGEQTSINHGDIDYRPIGDYQLEDEANRIILRETVSTTDNNVYVAFVAKSCRRTRVFENNCRMLRIYSSYNQMLNNSCEKKLAEKCNLVHYFECIYTKMLLKIVKLYPYCSICSKCWKYQDIDAKCRLPTMRIVNGFIICELEPDNNNKPLLAKINLTTGKIIIKRKLNDAKYTRNCLKSRIRYAYDKCQGNILDINVHIMVDNANIWILYNGKSNGILEQLNFKTLKPDKTIHVKTFNSENRAIVVSNKLYILSISGDQLSIIRAIDTQNPTNKMSKNVTVLDKFKHGMYTWMHYNPRFEQLFIGRREKRMTHIFAVEKCKYAYPKFIDFDQVPIKSTFIWSLYPNNHEYYKYIIQKISSFLRVTNPQNLKVISSILLSCPYEKCHHSNSTNDPYCRLKAIRLLFESIAKYKDPDFLTPLQVHFDMVKLLEQDQFREMSSKLNDLKNVINRNFINIKKEIHGLRSSLGSYFTTFANFDSKKSKSDLELFYSLYNDLNNKQNKIASTIKNKLSTLFRQATESNIAENVGQLANVVIASAAFVNPFSFFDSTDKVLQLQDRLAAVAKAIVDSVKLDKMNKVYFPRLKKLGDDLKPKIISMSKVFPNLKTLINKAMNKTLNAQQLSEYVNVFLIEYDSYTPAFEPSTIDEYEAILSEIVNELCRIIYEGESLASAAVQGVLASEGTCLATKLDVQTLMGLYRDMYDKQDLLMGSFASAVRATAARVNAERIRDIPYQIQTGHFVESEINYKLSALEILINSMIHTLLITREACTLIRYKNGNVMPKYCTDAIKHAGISTSDSVISSRLNRDMCDGVNIRQLVYIPAQQQSVNSPIPDGTIDLTRLYRGDEVVFQIPATNWLTEHDWIYRDQKDKMIVLKEFELFVPVNSSSKIYIKSTKRFISQNVIKPGGKSYGLNAPKLYQYNFMYSQGAFQCAEPFLSSTPYELPSCPKLPKICVLSKGKMNHPTVFPSIYSKFGIKLSTSGNIQEPHPKTKFYLMASVRLCIVEPIAEKRKRSPRYDRLPSNGQFRKPDLNKIYRSPVCCGESNKYYDPLSAEKPCKPCPKKSTAKFHGLYCD